MNPSTPCGTLVDVTSRSAHRGVRSLAFMTAAFVAGIAAGPARAAAPACFPERTVSTAITLRDDRRGVFGGLRAGQIRIVSRSSRPIRRSRGGG
jgi:hypothetical protein